MKIQCHSTIGGTKTNDDARKLERGRHVISGTPGRVLGSVTMSQFISFGYKTLQYA